MLGTKLLIVCATMGGKARLHHSKANDLEKEWEVKLFFSILILELPPPFGGQVVDIEVVGDAHILIFEHAPTLCKIEYVRKEWEVKLVLLFLIRTASTF